MRADSNKTRTWLERLLSHEPKDKDELVDMLRDAEERHLLSGDMLRMIECVIQVAEMQTREVMIPKSQMICIETDSTLDAILPLVIESAHSRFPVMDSSTHEITGIMLAKDLLSFCFNRDQETFDLQKITRPAMVVPQSKRLDILLREFRINRNHMAIVIDEYGETAGLITIEDVLEQIVGDIEDEYDIDEEIIIKKQADNLYTVNASTSIEDFNDYFKVEISDEEFDTIGGIILKKFGHMPKRGETLKTEGLRFKVLQSDNRRLYLLEVKKINKS